MWAQPAPHPFNAQGAVRAVRLLRFELFRQPFRFVSQFLGAQRPGVGEFQDGFGVAGFVDRQRMAALRVTSLREHLRGELTVIRGDEDPPCFLEEGGEEVRRAVIEFIG